MQQSLAPVSRPLNSVVSVPGSKSITNRALLLAALAQGHTQLSGVLFSDDSRVMMAALQKLGVVLHIHEETNTVLVEGCGGRFPAAQTDVYCQDAGTATRFLLAACAAQPQALYHFSASQRMMQRPNASLIQILQQQGAHVQCEGLPSALPLFLHTHGLQGGDVHVPMDESSQFLSGLLMAAPYAHTPMVLHAGNVAEKTYVRMTVAMMQQFAVECEVGQVLKPSLGCYQGKPYHIEPDASTASYFFAAAAIAGGRVTVRNIVRRGLQGDTQFLDVLQAMGCHVSEHEEGVCVQAGATLRGCQVHMRGFSDTFMTVAAVACFANSPTTLTGLAHTRLQESDRVSAMEEGLNRLGIVTETTQDSITIHPGVPRAGVVSSHKDHRIAMSLALLGLKVPGVVVDGAECVSKTCPDYFQRMTQLCAVTT